MQKETFELIAMFMRYWFTFLIVIITFRAIKWLLAERRAYRKTLRSLPDAGLIGELVDMQTGHSYPLPREGVIGGGHAADIRLKHLKRIKVIFQLVESKGIKLHANCRHQSIALDGEELYSDQYALHGSRLNIGPYQLRFRLFVGLDIPIRRHQHSSEDTQVFVYPNSTDDGAYPGFNLDNTWAYALSYSDEIQPTAEQFDAHTLAPLMPPEGMHAPSGNHQDRSMYDGEI
jgi:hypothetical protein